MQAHMMKNNPNFMRPPMGGHGPMGHGPMGPGQRMGHPGPGGQAPT